MLDTRMNKLHIVTAEVSSFLGNPKYALYVNSVHWTGSEGLYLEPKSEIYFLFLVSILLGNNFVYFSETKIVWLVKGTQSTVVITNLLNKVLIPKMFKMYFPRGMIVNYLGRCLA